MSNNDWPLLPSAISKPAPHMQTNGTASVRQVDKRNAQKADALPAPPGLAMPNTSQAAHLRHNVYNTAPSPFQPHMGEITSHNAHLRHAPPLDNPHQLNAGPIRRDDNTVRPPSDSLSARTKQHSFIRPPPGLSPRPPMNGDNSHMPNLQQTQTFSPPVDTATSSSMSRQDSRTTMASDITAPSTAADAMASQQQGGGSSTDSTLDKYAAKYVPTWLRQVNEDTSFTLIPLPDEPNYDFDAFVSSFLPRKLVFSDPDDDVVASAAQNGHGMKINTGNGTGKDLVKADSTWLRSEGDEDALEALEEEDVGSREVPVGEGTASHDKIARQRSTSASLPSLTPQTYAQHFTKLLQIEYTHREQVLASQALYDVRLATYSRKEGVTSDWSHDHLYTFSLPGVREDYPNLIPGDLLQLRVLASNSRSWLKVAFQAKVFMVQKVSGFVILKCDELASRLRSMFTAIKDVRFNIIFVSSAFRGGIEVFTALSRLGKYTDKRSSITGQALRRWLFPSPSIGNTPRHDPSLRREAQSPMQWYDQKLNIEQMNIVQDLCSGTSQEIPFLIHGPPGTGKTKTLVELTLQLLLAQSDARIILTAPSVTAADTLALRLASHLSPRQMTRINDPRRTFEEVPERLMIYCTIDEGASAKDSARFGLPEWERLMHTKVVVMATPDIHILHLCKVSNIELGRWQGTTFGSMMGSAYPGAQLHWTHLLVDEAGQSTEAEMINALLLVAPSQYHNPERDNPCVVLCGDIAQLGPQVESHVARSQGLDVSLLERLSKRKAYHQLLSDLRAQARRALMKGEYGPDRAATGTSEARLSQVQPSAAHLVRNYRATKASLLHVVSMLFYDDCLLPCATPSQLQLSFVNHFPNEDIPILFDHVSSQDEWVDEGASYYNSEEIDQVVTHCLVLTGKLARKAGAADRVSYVSAKDIAIITPYREQVWRLRIKLRKKGLAAVSVGNVEVFQGAEHKITILSTVRTSHRFLEVDSKRSMGLVFERKRLCVALSRAQEALIIVGNARLLRHDPYWRALISYCRRNNVFTSTDDNEEELQKLLSMSDSEEVGALEYASRMALAKTSNGASETDTGLLAGRVAASALYEEEGQEDEGLPEDEKHQG